MGAGLQRAVAAARATQIDGDDAVQMRRFLDALVSRGGRATPAQCPSATREQDRVRRKAKAFGWVTFVQEVGQPNYWSITDAGRAAFRNV